MEQNHCPFGASVNPMQSIWYHSVGHFPLSQAIIWPNDPPPHTHHVDGGGGIWKVASADGGVGAGVGGGVGGVDTAGAGTSDAGCSEREGKNNLSAYFCYCKYSKLYNQCISFILFLFNTMHAHIYITFSCCILFVLIVVVILFLSISNFIFNYNLNLI